MRAGGNLIAWVGAVALVAVVALAVVARYAEPASSPVIGAEDPYTHMVFTREHVADGSFDDSERVGVTLYPPGMHALVGMLWVWTGLDLYVLARWFPLVFGVVAAWGTFALLRRHVDHPAGALAGAAVAGFLAATNPEHVVRSDLLFPTGLDLALLPWIALGVSEALAGEWRGLAFASVMSTALVLAHPWIGFVVAGAMAAAAGLAVLLRREPDAPAYAAAAVAGVGAALVLLAAWYGRRFDSDKGMVGVGGAAAAAAASVALACLGGRFASIGRVRGHVAVRAVAGIAAAGAVAAAWWLVLSAEDLPLHVNYPRMFGLPLLVLASVGAVVAVVRGNVAGLVAFGAAVVTFPFTVFDFFDSWYLPHRTMVYLVAASAILAGIAVGELVAVAARALERRAPSRATVLAPAVAAVVVLATVGTVAAYTNDPYVWDRYVTDEEFAVLERAAERVEASGGREQVVTGSWVVNVMVGSLTTEDYCRYRDQMFKSPEKRAEVLDALDKEGVVPLLVVDGHTLDRAEEKGWDLAWLSEWTVLDQAGEVTVYGRP